VLTLIYIVPIQRNDHPGLGEGDLRVLFVGCNVEKGPLDAAEVFCREAATIPALLFTVSERAVIARQWSTGFGAPTCFTG
jgi:hypothetical protein